MEEQEDDEDEEIDDEEIEEEEIEEDENWNLYWYFYIISINCLI